MATTSAQPNKRECCVCMNDYETPKILPCGHLLCRACVIPLCKWSSSAVCPLCRYFRPSRHVTPSNYVNDLPTDFVMEALVQSARILAKDPVCCTCDANNKAEFICMQCLDMMCSSCHKIHKKMSVSRSHDVESLSTVTPERLAASGPPLCADHGDKQFLFCQDHGITLCASCKDERHSQCQAVNKLDDEMISAKKSLDMLIDRLNKEEDRLTQVIADMDSRIKDVDISQHEDLAQINKACDRLQTLVEDFRIDMKKTTESFHNISKIQLSFTKNACGEQLASVTSHKRILLRAKEVAPRPALIHVTKALTSRVNSFKYKLYPFTNPSTVGTCCEDKVREIEETLNSVREIHFRKTISMNRYKHRKRLLLKQKTNIHHLVFLQ